ncbi:penicillin-binding transpeptidase domain-containing protein [Niallia nealsonii]|uniref:serine-type D-Ala-D-Ala carboxypeptidase n=1 Tax=Niallia nealsonii TaxID=115979 RepID=A0A2N0Z7Z9_9BACI|nr:penicillin-binding transpeptidase domain-containing protein [Niallia nealsonii]PKG25641.1 peptidoglycan glycosyltransferase [Niallia nealsonii]
MKKKLMLVLMLLLLLIMAIGCSKDEPTPDERLSKFINLWMDQKFSEMYGYLSKEAKQSITKEDFVSRYEKLYSDLEINNIKATYTKPSDTDKKDFDKADKASIPLSASMNSAAGEIKFDKDAVLVKEEKDKKENWYINWDTTYIFSDLEKEDKVSIKTIEAERGSIVDKNETPLAMNGIIYEIGLVPEQLGDNKNSAIEQVAKLLDIKKETVEKALQADWVQPSYFVPIKKVATDDQKLLDKLFAIPGVQKQDTKGRIYPFGEASAHLIGYIGNITAEELEEQKGKGYSSTDVIGKRGLEQVYEEQLKGTNGVEITIVKADSSNVVLAEKPVENGKDLKLTIDADLQKEIYEEMDGEAGAATAINPSTGETMALVSSPAYDPNKMVVGLTATEREKYNDNKLEPFTNRFKLTYAPGSVLKPIVAAGALEEKVITPEKTRSITTKSWQKDKSWGSYYVTRVHSSAQPVNLANALLYSDNIYFAQTALDLGKDKYINEMKKFGFEEELSYPYPIEKSTIGKLDTDIQLADSGYGQGQVEMSVVQLAAAYSPFVNEGNLIKPTLLSTEEKGQVWKEKIISSSTAEIISDDLQQVIDSPNGTAHAGKVAGKTLAGKTGTAELKAKQGEKGTENGWYVAYDKKDKNFLIAMMIEGVQNKGGSSHIVKKVKKIIE